jgi:catalase
MTEPEQRHIVAAFAFELGKVETVAIRRRMLGHLALIEDELRRRVEEKLGMQGQAEAIDPARPPIEMDPSPALSIVRKAEKTLKGRKVGVLVSRDSDRTLVDRLRTAVDREGGQVEIVAPEIGAAPGNNGKTMADHALAAAPSIFFDAVVVAVGSEAVPRLAAHSGAIDWVRDAFAHLKVIGYVRAALPLIERADIAIDDGVLELCNPKDLGSFISAARAGRKWERERDIEQRIEGKAARRKPAMSRDEDAAFDRA